MLACVLATAVILVVLATAWAGNSRTASVRLGPSQQFSQGELTAAARCVKTYFLLNFSRCTMTELSYDEGESNRIKASFSWSELAPENSLVLLCSFQTGRWSGAFDPNSRYENWQWILTRDGPGSGWRVFSQGYA